jgi:hypothetical protein
MPSDVAAACREEVLETLLRCKTRGLRFGACHRQMPNPVALARVPLGSRLFETTRYGRPIARHHDRNRTGPALEVK